MIFVDTSAWFAASVRSDRNHGPAQAWVEENKEPLLTTDYVIDETLTLLKRRGEFECALELGAEFFSGTLAEIVRLTEADWLRAWNVFRHFKDKDWSFTDCTCKVVIEKLRISECFAFDDHFRQFGSVTVLPK